jgi:hypothetical protein
MHIITGMLLAGLFGQHKRKSLLPLINTGPVRAEHMMPGRVRFRVPGLADDASGADVLREKLPTIEGVTEVAVNASSGSVLVRYREKMVQPELLFAAIVRLLGLDKELERPPRPVIVRELRDIMVSLNRVVYDRTGGLLDFSSTVWILLAALGLRSLLVEGGKAMPAGFTLLWWGAHRLFGHGEE